MDIRRATDVDQVTAAAHLFDAPPREEATRRFLAAGGHHMFLAYEDGVPTGFVTGIEIHHPDKGVEMCLYEMGVDAPYRRRGIATALIGELAALARKLGCYDMWVPVDTDNEGALATYRATGARQDGVCAVLTWEFGG
ncbi:GNAT family N-acetyltransferase [Streptomyces sp. YC504]|uniref:GNAT family N-acetyltransferase n=1 Tax=Streptomyces mesophilus TaxID=1775132 RepID=A0A6G4XGZ8_9ACTN|nr:GNAT family N-acetyltransferase [Streptomyces mesophilus]NGO76678.1 GNAT family N-acetyltransferase [Streptomyces mesophilus]